MTTLCLNWVICMTGRSFFCMLNGNLEHWQVPHHAIKGSLIISHLHFSFALTRSRPPLCGSIQRSNLPCCCERAALQSQLWLSLQVLKWGLQKVNKLLFPPPSPSAHCCSPGSFRKVQEVHKASWRGHQVSSDCAVQSCWSSDILMRWNIVAHRRHENKGPYGRG